MLSLLRVATPPVALKLSSQSHQLTPHPPIGKRNGFSAVLVDASNSPAGDHPPVALCHLKGFNPLSTDSHQLPFLTLSLQVRDIGSDIGNNGIAKPDASLSITHSGSSFPVHGPFDLLYRLQDGAFGAAWAAKDLSTGRVLCLKVFRSVKDPNVTRSVQTELRAFRRMVKAQGGERGRQFIMELSRSFQHGTEVFFAMELMSTDLGAYLFYEPERCKLHARRWMAQMTLGIQSLHEMGVLHRDIKSENILIDSRENIRIIDFGLSFLYRPGVPRYHPIEFLGTPSYIAPEVLRNKGIPATDRTPYGIQVDWWALGCILFELESQDHHGQLLFDTEKDVHLYITWSQLSSRLEKKMMYPKFEALDPIIVDLLEGLLRIDPSTRYTFNDVEKHSYFLHRDGTSEFEDAASRALERPVRCELVPQATGDDGPDKVRVEAAKPASPYDWTNMKWALGHVDR